MLCNFDQNKKHLKFQGFFRSNCGSNAIYRRHSLIEDENNDAVTLGEVQRIFHGRGGAFPGCENLTIDFFPPVFVLTSYQDELCEKSLHNFGSAFETKWERIRDSLSSDGHEKQHPFTWVYQHRSTTKKNSGSTTLMSGEIPKLHIVQELGCSYIVHVLRGQNHGIFLDMMRGRLWVKQNAQDKKVLNLFAYTCAFSVAALSGGANEVVNVDMSKGALKIGQRNHEINNYGDGRARFLAHDIFKTWGKLKKMAPYDIIILDPPSYQKGSFIASKDYRKLCRRLPSLLSPGGNVLMCLNAPELSTSFLHDLVAEEFPELRFVCRLDNPESFPAINPEKSLKVLLFEYNV